METKIASAIVKDYRRQATLRPTIDISVTIDGVEYWVFCEVNETCLFSQSCVKSGEEKEESVDWALIEEIVIDSIN